MDADSSAALARAGLSGAAPASMAECPGPMLPALAQRSDVVEVHSSTWLALLARSIFWMLQTISTVLYLAIKLTTISMPTFLFTLFSTSLTITMNATTLMLILGLLVSAVTWVVRYRYLNVYSRLPPEPQRKEPEIDLFPDTHEEGVKSGLSNYFDEFLSAIKIFGYLERPVFHELTRSMQTRKLIAGETLNLEDEKGFCIVVDGLVEIFVKQSGDGPQPRTSFDAFSSEEEEFHHGAQRYQLLTEVRNGAPMSSLFSIMSLFTEDVPLRHTDEDSSESVLSSSGALVSAYPASADFRRTNRMLGSPPGSPQLDILAHKRASADDGEVDGVPTSANGRSNAHIPPISLGPASASRPRKPALKRESTSSAHPDIIARATVDTTIAIIPTSAFRRLIRIYPKATAHIVHVILSRFQRVTLASSYNYLGLTGEVLQTEKNMAKFTTCQLPNHLRGDALDRLKDKFSSERERMGEDELGKGIALHNSRAGRRRTSTNSLRKEAALHAVSRLGPTSSIVAPPRDRMSVSTAGPGDLLASIQSARSMGQQRPSSSMTSTARHRFSFLDLPPQDLETPMYHGDAEPFPTQRKAQSKMDVDKRETLDEDNVFRECILECIFKSIGLTMNGTSNSRETDSMQGSPRLVSFDQKRQKALFSNNAFGFMDSMDGSEGDAESVASSSLNGPGPATPHLLAQEMRHELEIVFFPKGSVLVEQGERNPGLYYVVDGFLDMCVSSEEGRSDILHSSSRTSVSSFMGMDAGTSANEARKRSATTSGRMPNVNVGGHGKNPKNAGGPKKTAAGRRSVALIKPGGLAGYVGTISSYRSFVDVVAKTDVFVGFLPRLAIERVVDRYPIVLLTMAKRLTSILPKLILHIDFALEWLQVNAGQVLFHTGDESEAIYIVINGRLRLVVDRKDGGVNVQAEFGQGESIGELEVLTESTRSGTLHAIRDTEVVKIPRTLFNSLAQEHPNITIKISKIIASRMRALVDAPSMPRGMYGVSNHSSSTVNLRTVAVLPVTAGVPVVEFGNRLMQALQEVGTPNGATSLNQAAILNHLGKHAFNKMGKLKLSQYLADLEDKYSLVVYVADTNVNSPWTQTCITQADCILLLAMADSSPEIGEYERFMLGMKSTARKILVLGHPERYSRSGRTRRWLKNRVWINGGHFHVQMPFAGNATMTPIHQPAKRGGPSLKERVQTLQAEIQKYTSRRLRHRPVYSPDTPYKGDFHRLARRLCGQSVGLVLGGGGARGIAHIGIIRAMEEAGVPIDMVGGTSIGSFIGALYARHADVVPTFGLSKKFSGRMASIWRFALDLTYPSASYTTGHEFNRGIFKTFGKAQIEDFWLEYYCNTTNISKSRAEFHTSGYAWRYVRASMSLAGLLPPLCDEGSMLLDGGYIDNLTVSRMKSHMGADVIFAVDVGAVDDDTPQAFGDTLSGVWAFFNRWNPLSSAPNPPTLAEIQARLAYVSSVDALERAKAMPGCFYMRPPIDPYGTLEFGKFDEIYRIGYRFGQEFLARLRERGALPLQVAGGGAKEALRRTMAPRRASI